MPETPSPGQPPARPRWVKMVALAAAALVLAIAGIALAVGDHGPGRHLGGDDASPSHTAPPGAHE